MKTEQAHRTAGPALIHRFNNGGASPTRQLLLLVLSLLLIVGCSKKEPQQKAKELVLLCGDSFLPQRCGWR